MGDRICVMKDGNIMQVAAPMELYNHPVNLFVAGFIGSPPMNFFRGTIRRANAGLVFAETNLQGAPVVVPLSPVLAARAAAYSDRAVIFGVRPEDIHEVAAEVANSVQATVDMSEPMGAETYLHLNSGATAFIARVPPTDEHQFNQRVKLSFNLANAHLFDAVTEAVI